VFSSIYRFYLDGFRRMRLGRTLWKIVLVKLLIMFAVVKALFFPDVLHVNYQTDQERSEHVLERLTQEGSTAEKYVSTRVGTPN